MTAIFLKVASCRYLAKNFASKTPHPDKNVINNSNQNGN